MIVKVSASSNASVEAAMLKAREKGARVIQCEPRGVEEYVLEAVLDVDYPLMVEVAEKICELWRKTKVCSVTSVTATDVSSRVGVKDRESKLGRFRG